MLGLDLIVVTILLSVTTQTFGQTTKKTASACYGASNAECGFFGLTCDTGSRIRILSAVYGVKTYNCKNDKRRCRRTTDGCCTYDPTDCTERYSTLHMYTLYRQCSGRQSCIDLQATFNILRDCDGETSTYVFIEYECVLDNIMLPICSGNNLGGTEVNLIFDGASDVYSERTSCDCFVFLSRGSMTIYFTDLRMITGQTDAPGSDCASASLTYIPSNTSLPRCSPDQNEEKNFVDNARDVTSAPMTSIVLSDLHKTGPSDKPTMVWLSLYAEEESGMQVTCAGPGTTLIPPITTTPTTTPTHSVSTSSSNGTDTATDGGGDGNTGAVVAGVLIPIILIAVAGVVVGYILWKRRKSRSEDRKHANPNSYTEDFSSSTNNEIYDEIGNVGNEPEPPIYDPVYEPPVYDPVYEPGHRGSASSTNSKTNGHLHPDQPRLSNASDVQIPTKAPKKHSKNPFQIISTRTDRLFAWFKNQRDSDDAKGKNRGREISQCSYDHIHGASPVVVHVTSPNESEGHEYSHTNSPTVAKPVNKSPKGGRISKDMSAVQVGDSYIEFTFDTIDRDDPKLLKAPPAGSQSDAKPVPPSRPVPSPSGSPKGSPRSASPMLPARPKSPATLSPITDRPMYDYVESQPNSRRGSDAAQSDVSDHSYKILEEQNAYDYAAPDDVANLDHESSTSHEFYEDIDTKSKTDSVDSDDAQDYEVPVKKEAEPDTTKVAKKHVIPKTHVRGSPDMSRLNKELLAGGKLKPLKPHDDKTPAGASKPGAARDKDKKNEINVQVTAKQPKKKESAKQSHGYVNAPKKLKSSDAAIKGTTLAAKNENDTVKDNPSKGNASSSQSHVKSDNVKTKDYEKADNLKGVLNMAKLFESKA